MRLLKRILTRLCHQIGVEANADNAADVAWGIMNGKPLTRDLCRNAKPWKKPTHNKRAKGKTKGEPVAIEGDDTPQGDTRPSR